MASADDWHIVCRARSVFPGVTIGDNVIVGANSVVNRDVPSNCVVVGAPIRVIREIEDDTE